MLLGPSLLIEALSSSFLIEEKSGALEIQIPTFCTRCTHLYSNGILPDVVSLSWEVHTIKLQCRGDRKLTYVLS